MGEDTRYLVSAWVTEQGRTLGQVQVADKSHEITAAPALLRALELTGCVVTATRCIARRTPPRRIKEADADYVLALKSNQGAACQEIKEDLDDAIARADPKPTKFESIEKGHGRVETRCYFQSADLGWFMDRSEWEGLQSVGVVEATRGPDDKIGVERRYYLCSLPVDVDLFARAVRGHWAIAWSLARTEAAPTRALPWRICAWPAGWALNLLRQDQTPDRSAKRSTTSKAY